MYVLVIAFVNYFATDNEINLLRIFAIVNYFQNFIAMAKVIRSDYLGHGLYRLYARISFAQ